MRISDWSSDVFSSDLAEADLVTGLINLLEVRIEDIEFQFEIKRTRAETDKAAADERAAIGFDNFLKHCGNACGVVGIGLIDDAKREFHPPLVKVHIAGNFLAQKTGVRNALLFACNHVHPCVFKAHPPPRLTG